MRMASAYLRGIRLNGHLVVYTPGCVKRYNAILGGLFERAGMLCSLDRNRAILGHQGRSYEGNVGWYNHIRWWRLGELSAMFMIFHQASTT